MSREMTKRVHRALADDNLQSALGRLTPLSKDGASNGAGRH